MDQAAANTPGGRGAGGRRLAARNQIRRLPNARPHRRGKATLCSPAPGPDWSHRYRRTIEALERLPVKFAYIDGELCALIVALVSGFRIAAEADRRRRERASSGRMTTRAVPELGTEVGPQGFQPARYPINLASRCIDAALRTGKRVSCVSSLALSGRRQDTGRFTPAYRLQGSLIRRKVRRYRPFFARSGTRHSHGGWQPWACTPSCAAFAAASWST